jgi:membrane-bound ClpP family serine protease
MKQEERREDEFMSRIYVFKLPYDYTLNLSTTELIIYGLLTLVILVLIIKSFFIEVSGGREGLAGQTVSAIDDFSGKGEVYEGNVICMGELWTAKADFPIKKGDRSIVSKSEALILFLSKIDITDDQKNSADGA